MSAGTGGYELEAAPPPSTPVLSRPPGFAPIRINRARTTRTLIEKLESWDGLVPPPESAEGFWRSLLYPLWGSTGLGFLVVFPILWWFVSLPTYGYLNMVMSGEASGDAPIRAIVPSIMGLIAIFGYTLLVFGQVLYASALGEVRHPRWPEAEMYEIFRGLFRWFCALLSGFLVGGVPAIAFWKLCGTTEPLDQALFLGLLALGVFYTPMALLATMLFDDPLAANPWTVGQAFLGIGLGYLRPCLVAASVLALAAGIFLVAVRLQAPALALAGLWIFWIFVLYGGLVVMRLLGLEYYRNAGRVGWFRESRRSHA